jgi:hypothetical protein
VKKDSFVVLSQIHFQSNNSLVLKNPLASHLYSQEQQLPVGPDIVDPM